ncbi:torsin-1A-like isoform X2 [Gadus morhua]|uniref:torsin-1A-like isoform X2 n=1 Tax=Gadus morhua TaxID=8049 RepID=UPI0011B6F13F|nr:torsin-1A-like isoform X2 [Gadus morhua]
MNSIMQLTLLLFLLVGACRADYFFGDLKDWFDKITAPNEYCNREWITLDGKGYGKGLEADLGRNLFGQHIASEVIVNAVTGFMNNDNPKKPLVLSFHGTAGTGKTLASQLIVKNIYKKGMDSRFVHFFNSVINFPHASQVETYKSQLQLWIRGNVTNCAHSMFIFDEMDKMHPGIIDSIKPFMDYQYKLDGVSYQKAIFIFLSNAGGKIITQTTLVSWKAGKKREELKLEDVETALSSSVFNYHGESYVVDFFIPFLPLERQHIVQCIMVEMVAMGLQSEHNKACEMADKIVIYIPDDERRISVSGCKRIASRLKNFM